MNHPDRRSVTVCEFKFRMEAVHQSSRSLVPTTAALLVESISSGWPWRGWECP